MKTFQEILSKLSAFWEKQGCITHQGYDLEVGAGTFNPATFLRCLGPEPYNAAYVEPTRRPTDGRYGENPNRTQHYFQYQVILKPSPSDIQEAYLKSLEAIGVDLKKHDIRFVHDDWENPTIGASGLGWEAWIDGMEVTQITYFQTVGGIQVKPVTGELTYGLERIALYLQGKDSIFDLQWNDHYTYGDLYHRNEVEWSTYNFEKASVDMWFNHFNDYEREAKSLIQEGLPLPAYDFVMKASHAFNLLDARGAISVTERTGYIGRIRSLAKEIAKAYIESREKMGYPFLEKGTVKKKAFAPPSLEPSALEAIEKEEAGDYLLEIGSEELPVPYVTIGLDNLKKSVEGLLKKEELSFDRIDGYATPRRLALIVRRLQTRKDPKTVEKKGPPVKRSFDQSGKATKTGEGFLRSLGFDSTTLESVEKGEHPFLFIETLKGTEYLYARIETPAESSASILAEKLPRVIADLQFPKKMRWADLDVTYARPILWIVSLFGKTHVPVTYGNIFSGSTSFGHRQLDPSPVPIISSEDYVEYLRSHKVMVDVEERKREILRQLSEIENELSAESVMRSAVVDEVLNLVEWPQLTHAEFNEEFLKAPKELLVSEMIEHQKYFPLAKQDGSLINRFVITANNTPSDNIRAGNRKVLSSRLSDGVFLYEQDLKLTLDQFNEKLKSVTFQKELGTVYEKVERLVQHVKTLHETTQMGDPDLLKQAATYCKADLASSVVFEFPELQGTMGKYYTLNADLNEAVALAIEEHWMPLGEKAPLPSSKMGVVLSIADKLDNLIGCFACGMKPSSSSDPYALRRQVLGVVKMVIREKLHLPLKPILNAVFEHYNWKISPNKTHVIEDVMHFIGNRLKAVFEDYGFSKDLTSASLSFGIEDIYDTYCRVKALHAFRQDRELFSNLYEVYKRAKGQLDQQEIKSFNASLLQENEEIALDRKLNEIIPAFEACLSERNYDKAYGLIAELQPPLNHLFDHVKILADDPKTKDNRIALLQRVFSQFEKLLDFSQIQE